MTASAFKRRFARLALVSGFLLPVQALQAQPDSFAFGVIAPSAPASADEATLREIITAADSENLAFVVASGVKASDEPCSDALYQRRRNLFNGAKNGLIVSLAGGDWIGCLDSRGRPVAQERLNRLRELFYGDEFSLGSSRIPVIRQSTDPKFRSYAENMRWEVGTTMFATLNLPAANNHYRREAGRNSEFEDRLIANREWAQRVFAFATRKRFDGVVLFCDGNPLLEPSMLQRLDPEVKRDGFLETRRELLALAKKFPGKVLLVFNQTTALDAESDAIRWRANIGVIGVRSGWIKFRVNHADPALYSIVAPAPDTDAVQ